MTREEPTCVVEISVSGSRCIGLMTSYSTLEADGLLVTVNQGYDRAAGNIAVKAMHLIIQRMIQLGLADKSEAA